MTKDLVSIIIPVYNVQKYLQDCFLSIENQTYKKLEIIFINDGSKDNSKSIIEEFCSKHSYAHLYNQENAGIAAARNAGFSKVTGEYLYFLDPDDFIHPQVIEKFVQIAKKEDADLVWSKNINVFENSKYASRKFKKLSNKYIVWSGKDEIVSVYLGIRSGVTNKLFKTQIFKSLPEFPNVVDKNIVFGEDAFISVKYLIHGNKIVLCKSPAYYYRIRKSSLVHKPFYKGLLSTMDCLKPLDNVDKNIYKNTIINVKGLKSVYAFFLLYKMKNSDFKEIDVIENLYKIYKENLKYVRKSKHLNWYIKYLFCFTRGIAHSLYKRALKRAKK